MSFSNNNNPGFRTHTQPRRGKPPKPKTEEDINILRQNRNLSKPRTGEEIYRGQIDSKF